MSGDATLIAVERTVTRNEGLDLRSGCRFATGEAILTAYLVETLKERVGIAIVFASLSLFSRGLRALRGWLLARTNAHAIVFVVDAALIRSTVDVTRTARQAFAKGGVGAVGPGLAFVEVSAFRKSVRITATVDK